MILNKILTWLKSFLLLRKKPKQAEQMTDAVDAVDMLLSQLDSLGFISTISPSGYAYVFNKSEEIVARITTDNTVSNNCLVNSGASIKDIFSLSQELEQFRKDKQIVVSVSPMIYDTESKKVLYGQDAVNFKKLLDLRTDTVN